MNNLKSLPSFWPVQMLFVGVCLAALFLLSTGCGSPERKHEPAKPVVNLYGVGYLYGEGKMIDCPGIHCEDFAGSKKDCESGEFHPYTGYRPAYSLPAGYMGQGKPFDLGSFLRSKGITTVNIPPVDTVGLAAPTSHTSTGDVTDHFYGDDKRSTETKSTTADSGPFGWDIPSLDPDLLTWVLFLIGLALLLMLLRWLWRTFFSSRPRDEDRMEHVLRHQHETIEGLTALRGFMHRRFPEEQPAARPAAVADANATESVTAEDLISISVKGGGPNVLTEDISLTGTINVKRTFRDPNPPATPAPSAPRGAE